MDQSVISYLIKNYYGEDPQNPHPEVYSSLWLKLKEHLKIETDQQGNIISLSAKGTGLDTFDRRHKKITQCFDYACIFSHLIHLPNRLSLLKSSFAAQALCQKMNRPMTFEVFQQVCSLELLKRNLSERMRKKRLNILFIGDGYGILAALWKQSFPNSTLILVDLGEVLLFQAHYCQRAHPNYRHVLVGHATEPEQADFIYCPAEEMDQLYRFQYDVAVNIVSMHEMNFPTISRYFDLLRARFHEDNLFYCCNRERKHLIGGEETHFMDYPWKKSDKILLDEFCPWHQYYFSPYTAISGPRIGPFKIPGIHFYDYPSVRWGRIWHRLAVLAK